MSKNCLHCQLYNKSKIREQGKRFCRESQKFVASDDKACSDFSLAPYFYCEKEGIWQHVICCVKRQHKKFPDICRACSKGEEVMDMCRGKDLYTHFNLRRQNLDRREDQQSEPESKTTVEINLRKRA